MCTVLCTDELHKVMHTCRSPYSELHYAGMQLLSEVKNIVLYMYVILQYVVVYSVCYTWKVRMWILFLSSVSTLISWRTAVEVCVLKEPAVGGREGGKIGRAHVSTPVPATSRMPSSA